MLYEKVRVRVDDRVIADGDLAAIIEPVWWTANIYDGPDEYELSLLQFSLSQRRLFAVRWYFAEVNNGGHRQFYSNSTGIVWRDALKALRALDALEFGEVLERSAELMGGSPSADRGERCEQMALFAPDFNELDDRFYEIGNKDKDDIDRRMLSLVRAYPKDFYFDGIIRRAVLPR